MNIDKLTYLIKQRLNVSPGDRTTLSPWLVKIIINEYKKALDAEKNE